MKKSFTFTFKLMLILGAASSICAILAWYRYADTLAAVCCIITFIMLWGAAMMPDNEKYES